MTTPRISVVVDTYNYGRFIDEAVGSVLNQDFPKDRMEILVVDDGSTDDTAERVRKYRDAVKYFRKENGGQASVFNFGIARANGELVAFLDGDDVWMPHKLSLVVGEFEKDTELMSACHGYRYWDPRDGWEWEPLLPWPRGGSPERRNLLRYASTPTSSLVFRRAALERMLPVPEYLRFMADAYLVGTGIFMGPIGLIEDCLAKNRAHGENLWFAERGEPGLEGLRRRIEMRGAAIAAVENWIGRNVKADDRPKARIVLGSWRLARDQDEFRLKPPGRLRFFIHLCRKNVIYGPLMTRAHLAYNWIHALAGLIVGVHAHYLEGIRTRVKRLRRRSRGQQTVRPREST